jgi:hypothetical protein
VQFTHVRSDGGAPETVAYLGRCEVLDVRLAQRFDFQHLGGDLVHSEIMLTEGVSKAFEDLEYLANGIDEAEVYRLQGDIDNRLRRTQNGAVLVLALPPASEMTLTEAIELTKRVALSIAGNRRLAIHIVIHDPAMMHPGARNRHAHLFFPRRELENDEVAGPAIRDLFARPLQVANSDAVTVEGNRWPDFYRRQQQRYFAELGIELVVDPIAPFPGRHWPSDIRRDDPRIQRSQSRTRRLNVQAIHADPARLLDKLLRGLSMIRIAELQRLLDRFIDSEAGRQSILETILSRPDIVTLAIAPAAAKPRFVTTAAVYDSVRRACELVDRAAGAEGLGAICAITAASHAAVVKRFDELFGRTAWGRPLVLGNNHSESRNLSNVIRHLQPEVATIKRALSDPKSAFPGQSNAKSRAQSRLIIVSRAESVEDQTLAKLIIAAHERSALLILLHDQSKQNGIVSRRLAAYAADRLATVEEFGKESYAEAVERLLGAGLIGPAIQSLAQHRDMIFKTIEDPEETEFDFLVCNDSRKVKDSVEEIRSFRLRQGKLQAPTRLGHPLKPVWLSQGERIVFTRDDHAVRPPKIRAGEIAQILEIDSTRNAIRVALSGGGIETIELRRFSHFRSAHAIPVRDARYLDREYSLQITVTDAHHVWAALVLAVQHPLATLVIDPSVATDIPSLIAATHRSVHAALPHQLTPRRDPNAEIVAIVNGTQPASPISGTFEPDLLPEPAASEIVSARARKAPRSETFKLERFPEPAPPARNNSPPIAPLHERARAILDLNPHTRRGVERLREMLSNGNPDQNANAENVLSLWGENTLMAEVVRLLQGPRSSSTETTTMINLDLPPEIEQWSPREWDDWELYRLRIDLSALQFDFANWPFAPEDLPDDQPRPQ